MRSAIATARTAALSFLRESNQDDEHFLVEFNERPTIVEDFTTDIHRLEDRVVSAQVTGSTALYDAVELALEHLAHGSRSRKALVLISDGENNHSRYNASEVVEFAKDRGIPIYSVGFALQKP